MKEIVLVLALFIGALLMVVNLSKALRNRPIITVHLIIQAACILYIIYIVSLGVL